MSENWITVKAPTMLYLPVVAESGNFKDSGRRIEVTDKIELLPGTNRIRINGMDLLIAIPCDNIPVQDGVIRLSRPAPPVRLSNRGRGWAVGRSGEAQRHARGGWDTQAAEEWEGDASSHVAPMNLTARGGLKTFPIVQSDADAAQVISFGVDSSPGFDNDHSEGANYSDDVIADAFDDGSSEIREITLKGGAKAHARFDIRTGKQIGTPFRQYQARYGENGQQLSAPAPTHGPKATFDMDEYRRRMAEQRKHATIAPTAAERYDIEEAREREAQDRRAGQAINQIQTEINRVDAISAIVDSQMPCTSTGIPHLDNLIAGTCGGIIDGFPLGKITHVYGEAAIQIFKSDTNSIAEAFGRIHLLKPGQQLVIIELEIQPPKPSDGPTDLLRLSLAEELPVLDNMIKDHPVAVVLVTPDWGDQNTPALLRFTPALRIAIEPHDRDERFVTATITKQDTKQNSDPTSVGKTASFPLPG